MHRLAIAGEEFFAVRDWQDGDDLRKVHWRSTARRGSLQIRQDETPPNPRATILVDTRSSSRPGANAAVEWAISAAASIVWELARQGVTPESPPSTPRWGQEAIDPILTTLASAGNSTVPSLNPAIRSASKRPGVGGAIFAIIAPQEATTLRALTSLRSSFNWCGAVLLDVASFAPGSARERAHYDQRLADAEHTLGISGWRVAVAASTDKVPQVWQSVLGASTSRSKQPSPGS